MIGYGTGKNIFKLGLFWILNEKHQEREIEMKKKILTYFKFAANGSITLNFPTLDCPYLGCLICRIHPVSHPIIYNPDYTYLVCFIIKYLTQFSNSYAVFEFTPFRHGESASSLLNITSTYKLYWTIWIRMWFFSIKCNNNMGYGIFVTFLCVKDI